MQNYINLTFFLRIKNELFVNYNFIFVFLKKTKFSPMTKSLQFSKFFIVLLLPVIFFACKKDSDDIPEPTGPDPVTDVDGNTYQTVQIGNQIWMAENLKVEKLNDGGLLENFNNYS